MLCYFYCPDASILIENDMATGVDLAHCKGCGICAAECPVGRHHHERRGEGVAVATVAPILAVTGNEAVAEAMRQINPDVVAAYPITPQTEIVQIFAQYVADGKVDTEFITVESEHSAMSAAIGSAAGGARTMTATSSQGLALMWELLHMASGYRVPIVMANVNRALSGPINIHCDHSDSMGARDTGWIQLYGEAHQEAYDNHLMAVRIAEHPEIRTPVMTMTDGFIVSGAIGPLQELETEQVQEFIGPFKAINPMLDVAHPVTVGPFDGLHGWFFEHKASQQRALEAPSRSSTTSTASTPRCPAAATTCSIPTAWTTPSTPSWSSARRPAPPAWWSTSCAARASRRA